MPRQTHYVRELLLLLLLATCWGSSYTFLKFSVETIPPLTLIAARTLIAGGLLLAVLKLRGLSVPSDRWVWGRFLIQACLNTAVPFTLIAWAEQSVEASRAVILNSLTPVAAFLITALITRHEAVTARKLFGVIAGLTGASLIIGIDALNGIGREVVAQLAVVAATILYACGAIYGKNFRGLDPMMPAAGSLICGAALLIPISIVIDHPWTLAPSKSSLIALLALSVFSTSMAFVIYFRLVNTLGSVATTSQAFLRVPIGVGIGAIVLEERLSIVTWVGLAFVLVGVIAMTLPAKKAPSLR